MEKVFYQNIYSKFDYCQGSNKKLINEDAFTNLKYNNKIYLLHITSNYSDIIKSGLLYTSTGCMFGGVYTTPLYFEKEKNLFRLHNLGVRYNYEINNIAKNNNKNSNEVQNLILEIDIKENKDYICGINYLKAGGNHYQNVLNIINKYPNLKESIFNNINPIFANYNLIESLINSNENDLISYINSYANNFSILSFLYFEAFSIAFMLNDKSNESKIYLQKNELYNYNYKNSVFELYPEFFKQFDLTKFNPTYSDLKKHFSNINYIDFDLFYCDLILILKNLIKDNLFDFNNKIELNNFLNIDKTILNFAYPFIGHQLRLLKLNTSEFLNFKNDFHKLNAEKIWKILNNNNKIIYYNNIIPKGEIAFNPSFSNNVKIYNGKLIKNSDSTFYYLEKKQELNIKTISELVNNKFILMNSHKINIKE